MQNNPYAHRKQKAVVRLLKDGKPVPNADIRLAMKRHAFLFGCGAFESINRTPAACEDEKSSYKTAGTEQEAQFYRDRMEMWLELFNFGTLPFYWGKFEPEEGKTIAPQVKEAALWLKSRGVTLKGHPLCWHTNSASWLLKYSTEEILEKQRARIARDVADFQGIVDMWDVINEVVIMPEFDKYDNPVTRICREYGQVETVRYMFEEARRANPNGTLLLNDFNTSSKYETLIARCLDAGIRIDAIGIQSHQHQGYWGDEKLYDVLRRFSRFGLPIHFTENTFTSGHLMPAEIVDLNDYTVSSWPTTEEAQERQCRDLEHFYRILFENPQVQAITNWAFEDGHWLGAPGGMVTADNRKKPSFYTLKRLIKQEWWTDMTARTGADGTVELDGFRGEYTACVAGREIPVTLGTEQEIILRI